MIRDEIIRLRKSGSSLRKIQEELGCSRSTISKWCATLKENQDIISNNLAIRSRYGTEGIHKRRNIELLRQAKPNNPSWFSDYKSRLRDATKAYLLFLAGGKCQICNYSRCKDGLVFHHIKQSTKNFNLSGMKLTYNIIKVLEEAKKCCLLCSNCHAEVHAGLVKSPASPIINYQVPENVIEWYVQNCSLAG